MLTNFLSESSIVYLQEKYVLSDTISQNFQESLFIIVYIVK